MCHACTPPVRQLENCGSAMLTDGPGSSVWVSPRMNSLTTSHPKQSSYQEIRGQNNVYTSRTLAFRSHLHIYRVSHLLCFSSFLEFGDNFVILGLLIRTCSVVSCCFTCLSADCQWCRARTAAPHPVCYLIFKCST